METVPTASRPRRSCGSSTSPPTRWRGAREEIDALNVYPVPDGDTGTNMFLTVSRPATPCARRRRPRRPPTSATRWRRSRRGALLGARGNSGVILSQMLGAYADRSRRAPRPTRNARSIAEAMQQATEASYAAVGRRSRAPSSPSRAPPPTRRCAAADAERPGPGRLRRGRGRRPRGPGPHPRAAAGSSPTPGWSTPADAGLVRGARRRRDRLDRSSSRAGDAHGAPHPGAASRSPVTTSPRTARPTR